jgi:hypothetical protein
METMTIKEIAGFAKVTAETVRKIVVELYPQLVSNGVQTVLNETQSTAVLGRIKMLGKITANLPRVNIEVEPTNNLEVKNLFESPLEMAKHQLESMLKMITAIQETQSKQKEQDSRITQLENRVQKKFSDDFENQFVTPTQIGAMFEPVISAKVVNRFLQDYNLQWKVDGQWVPREQGKKYSCYDYIQLDSGKTVPQLLWKRKVKELLT